MNKSKNKIVMRVSYHTGDGAALMMIERVWHPPEEDRRGNNRVLV